MEKIKILMVLTYYYPYCSGVTEYARRLAEELVKSDYEVTVFTSRYESSLKKRDNIHGVEVIRNDVLFRLGKGVVSPFFVLRGMLLSRKFDYVNLHLPLFESGVFAMLIPKNKLVLTYHCDLTLKGGVVDKIIETLYYLSAKLCAMRSGRIVAYTKDYASKSLVLSGFMDKVSYAYPFIDSGHFKSRNKFASKKKLGIRSESVVVGFIGRFVFEKGISYLLDTMPILIKKYPSVKFVLAGDYKGVAGGSVYSSIRKKIEKFKDNIILTGAVPYEGLPYFYSACDVTVLPSIDKIEAFGIVQVESMLCGTPVVASDLPGVRVPVRKTGMGLIVESSNSELLAEGILKVIRNRSDFAISHDTIRKAFDSRGTINSYKRNIFARRG